MDPKVSKLFERPQISKLDLRNRVVMAPMTRSFAPSGIPTPDMAAYYARRAAAEVGLIVTEGIWVDHPGASNDENVPVIHGDEALAGWSAVVDAVHAAGGKIVPQLWHVGQFTGYAPDTDAAVVAELGKRQVGPSGMVGSQGSMPKPISSPITVPDIDAVIEAFVSSAETAKRLGFDGVALHGAHGYLLDQFFWEVTNRRSDRYGGGIAGRGRFVAEIVGEIRRRTGPDFPIMLRYSQWKLQDYGAKLAHTPQELETFLAPLVDAGVDIFDCSQRRFWETEFDSDLNLAGWTKKLTGKPTMTVGSVGLDQEIFETFMGATGAPAGLEKLLELLERGDFDLVGVGRALLVDPDWVTKVKNGKAETALPFSGEALARLY